MFTNAAGDGETTTHKTKIIHNNQLTTVNNNASQKRRH